MNDPAPRFDARQSPRVLNITPTPPPPHDAAAEQALLGAMLLAPQDIATVDGLIDASDFYFDRNRLLFAALREMDEQRIGIDPLTLEDHLARSGLLDAIGGPLAILEVRDSTPAAANQPYYAAIVRRHALRRRIIAACVETAQAARDATTDEYDLIDGIESLAFEALAKIAPVGKTAEHGVHAIARHILESKQDRHAIPIGLRCVDDLSDQNGYPPGFLVLLAARPTMGKTALASTFAGRVSGNKIETLYIALEPPGRVVWNTSLSINIGASIREAIEHGGGPDAWAKEFAKLPLRVLERLGQPTTLSEIRGIIRRDVIERGAKFVVIDQLSTIVRDDAHRSVTEREWYSHCGVMLKNLAEECGIVLMVLHQINRDGGKQRRPSMLHLAGCGRLEEVADSVILWDRDEGRGNLEGDEKLLRDDQGWLSVPKRREGRTLREAIVSWHGPTGTVADDPIGLPIPRKQRERDRTEPKSGGNLEGMY